MRGLWEEGLREEPSVPTVDGAAESGLQLTATCSPTPHSHICSGDPSKSYKGGVGTSRVLTTLRPSPLETAPTRGYLHSTSWFANEEASWIRGETSPQTWSLCCEFAVFVFVTLCDVKLFYLRDAGTKEIWVFLSLQQEVTALVGHWLRLCHSPGCVSARK